jgi:hypothetical protein
VVSASWPGGFQPPAVDLIGHRGTRARGRRRFLVRAFPARLLL